MERCTTQKKEKTQREISLKIGTSKVKVALLNVQKNQQLANIGEPMTSFTVKARPYLISTTIDDGKNKI